MGKVISLLDNRYDIYITPEAQRKMELYCDLSEGEIGWLAFVKRVDKVGFLIEDCALLKQEVHATTTEITPEGLLDFWSNIAPEKQIEIKMWGHSHVNMSTSPSGQDDSQMEYFKDGNPWFIRLITNKKREYHIDVYDYENGVKVHMDQSDLKVYDPTLNDLKTSIEAEIKEKVSEKTYKSSTPALPKAANPYYDTYWKGKKSKKKEANPILTEVEVKYVSSFADVLSDPNYWQDILA